MSRVMKIVSVFKPGLLQTVPRSLITSSLSYITIKIISSLNCVEAPSRLSSWFCVRRGWLRGCRYYLVKYIEFQQRTEVQRKKEWNSNECPAEADVFML
jgi:hypothetical protein